MRCRMKVIDMQSQKEGSMEDILIRIGRHAWRKIRGLITD